MAALPVERTLRPGSLMTTEMKVDLPVPLRPTRPTFSPAPTTNEASRSRVRSPISMVREEPTIMGRGRGDRGRRVVPGRAPGVPGEVNPTSLPQVGTGPVSGSPDHRVVRTHAGRVGGVSAGGRAVVIRARRCRTMARKANWWIGQSSHQ